MPEPFISFQRLAGKALFWSLAAFSVAMPIQAIGSHPIPLPLTYIFLACAVPSILFSLRASRDRPTVLLIPAAVLLLALAVSVSELFGGFSIRASIRFFSYFIIVAGFTLLSPRESRRRLLAITLWTGAILCGASLLGYATFGRLIPSSHGITPFSYASAHPVFAGIPRFTGTMGIHPQDWGEYALLLLGLSGYALRLPALRLRRLALVTAGLATVSLVLTFSMAWIGGLWIAVLFVPQWFSRWRVLAFTVKAFVLLATLAAMWTVNVGFPTPSKEIAAVKAAPCSQSDAGHFVARIELSPDAELCHFVWRSWPYRHRLTTYLQAKETAIEAIRRSPVFGAGQSTYCEFADDRFAATLGEGSRLGSNYTNPHSAWFGIPAQSGLLGLSAWLFLVFLLVRRRPAEENPERFLYVTILVFLVLGVDWSIEKSLCFWSLVGWLSGALPASSPSTTATGATPAISIW